MDVQVETAHVTRAREIRVAIVEGRPRPRASLRTLIEGTPGYAVAGVFESVEDAAPGLELHPPEVAVVGVHAGDSPDAAVRKLTDRFPALLVLVLASDLDEARALAAVRAGAGGYLLRDTPPARMLEAIRELRDGGAPMAPVVARALVRSFRESPPPPAVRLSRRETEILTLMAAGRSYKTAAAELGVSIDTIRFHLRNVYAKLHVHSKVEAVLRASREGLLP